MTDSSARSPLDWLTATVLVAALTLLYLLTTGATPMSDGVCYAARIESADPRQFIDRQHALYGAAGYLFHGLLSLLRPGLHVWDALLVLSALSGGFCVAVFFLIARRIGIQASVALPCSLLLAESVEFWRHAANVEYIVPNALVVSLFLLMLARCAQHPSSGHAFTLGLLYGLAMLAHLRHVLLFGALLTVLVLSGEWRKSLPRALLAAGSVLVLVYVPLGVLHFGTAWPVKVWGWALSNSVVLGGAGASPWWVLRARNLLWAPIWQLGAVMDVAHVRHLIWSPHRFSAWAPVVAALVLSGAVCGVVFAFFSGSLRRRGPRRAIVASLTAWLIPYGIFFALWCPSEEAWWVVGLLPVWALVSIGASSVGGRRPGLRAGLLLSCVALLAVLNVVGPRGILAEHRHAERSVTHLQHMRAAARESDVVLWLGYLLPRLYGPDDRDLAPNIKDWPYATDLIGFYLPVHWFGTLEVLRQPDEVVGAVEQALGGGHTVWVSLSECSREATLRRLRQYHAPSASAVSSLLDRFELTPSRMPCLWVVSDSGSARPRPTIRRMAPSLTESGVP